MTTLTLNIDDLQKKSNNGKNDIVILTKTEYNKLIKELNNLKYWQKIDSRMADIKEGKGVLKPAPDENE